MFWKFAIIILLVYIHYISCCSKKRRARKKRDVDINITESTPTTTLQPGLTTRGGPG
jgi:hypothetical protein